MRALRCLATGIRAMLTSPRLLLFLWLANAAMAIIPAAVLFFAAEETHLGYATQSGSVTAFDWVRWVDFERRHALVLSSLTHVSGWLILAALVLQTFLMGGVLEVLDTPGRRFSMERLFGGAGRRFGAFLGLLILELLMLWGLDFVWNGLLGSWLQKSYLDDLTNERVALAAGLAQAGAFIALFYVIRTAFDYARVRTVVEDRASFVLAGFAGWTFMLGHLLSVLLLLLYVALLHLGLIVLARWAEGSVEGAPLVQMLLLLLLHQVFVFVRLGFRVGDYTAKIELFRHFRSRQAAVTLPSAPAGAAVPSPAEA